MAAVLLIDSNYQTGEVMTVEKTLEERGSRYGEFKSHANIAQVLKGHMRSMGNWDGLDSAQNRQNIERRPELPRLMA